MENQNERLKNLVAKMTLKNSYWGYLFSRVRRVASENIPSIMGVVPEKDGTISLLFHPDLLSKTSDDVVKLIITHEGMHLLHKHISRLLRIIANEMNDETKAIKIDIWNIAADCAVNPVINMPEVVEVAGRPFNGCFPKLYGLKDKKASEYYYNNLINRVQIKKVSIGDLTQMYDKVDDHSTWSNIVKQVSDISSLSRKVDGYIQNIIKDSLKSFQKKRGLLPNYISELIESALAPPKVPYFQIIRKLVKGSRLSKFKRSFAKVNRKRTYVFEISEKQNFPAISPFPGRTRDFSFNIVVLIDTSGSMSPDDIREGLSGVKNIIENDRHTNTIVLENDAKLQKEYKVKKIHDIDFHVKGRGGTTLQPGLERARELYPDVCLTFTDGMCDNINNLSRKLLPKKIIWVIQKDGTAENVNKTGYIVRI